MLRLRPIRPSKSFLSPWFSSRTRRRAPRPPRDRSGGARRPAGSWRWRMGFTPSRRRPRERARERTIVRPRALVACKTLEKQRLGASRRGGISRDTGSTAHRRAHQLCGEGPKLPHPPTSSPGKQPRNCPNNSSATSSPKSCPQGARPDSAPTVAPELAPRQSQWRRKLRKGVWRRKSRWAPRPQTGRAPATSTI